MLEMMSDMSLMPPVGTMANPLMSEIPSAPALSFPTYFECKGINVLIKPYETKLMRKPLKGTSKNQSCTIRTYQWFARPLNELVRNDKNKDVRVGGSFDNVRNSHHVVGKGDA